ncbi:MAG: hypothetical protein KF852_08515 [Saprospiraceae bacterium]|nr:hypothetical protein [Saprospiraceae bacterium]
MNSVELRQNLHQLIDELDEHFLNAVHSLVSTYQENKINDPIAGYDIYGNPKRAGEMMAVYEKRLAAMAEGNFITAEDLRKESESWIKATK